MQHLGHRAAQEGGHDCRRRFVGTQTVGVGGAGNGGLQQGVVLLHGGQDIDKEGDELEVALGVLARSEQLRALVGAKRPVVVFAGTVHAVEGLLVQEHHEAVLAGDAAHQVHHDLVLVVREVGLAVDRRELELVRGHFVVAGFQRNAEAVAGDLQVTHESGHAGRDGAEVVIVQLLVLGGVVAEQGAAGDHQVRAGGVERLVDEEVLLLPAQVGIDLGHTRIEEFADRHGSVADGLEGFLERGLVIKRLAGIGNENSRDAEGVVQDEDRGGRIPGGVAAGFEGGADAAVREGGGVRLLLYEHLAVEGLDDAALAVVVDQGVVFFGGAFGQGLEPVGDVGYAVLHRPFFHAAGHAVGRLAVEGLTAFNAGQERLEAVGIQVFAHFLTVEHEFAEVLGSLASGDFCRNLFSLKGFLHQIKSVHKHYTYKLN